MVSFHIITRCTRLNNLLLLKDSIFKTEVDVTWHILFDTSVLKDIPSSLLLTLQDPNIKTYFVEGKNQDYLYPQAATVAKSIQSGYINLVDDDNIVHPSYYSELSSYIEKNPSSKIVVVNQFVDKKDFTGLDCRLATLDNIRLQGVDIAQLTIERSVFENFNFVEGYDADGYFVEVIKQLHPEWFSFIDKTLCFYNYLTPKIKKGRVPKILLISEEYADLKSYSWLGYEDTSLDVLWIKNDSDLESTLITFNPDAIVAVSDDYLNFPNLCNQPIQVRNKWITVPKLTEDVGEKAYYCAMQNMLLNDNSTLISYYTPIYNTGDKLYKTYESLKNQTYNNWEWVVVNDSTDGGKTLKIAENIASKDSRVKVYDFREKSGGIIGESKYRAATLCKGFILAELDHDDLLTENCSQLLYNAAKAFPDAGFYYGDSVEIDINGQSLKYLAGFAFNYGSYRKVGDWDVAITANINPKTIRHIVGVPNHVRAWKREVYFAVGGHNRSLSIADDYELIIRTFLHTKFVKIPELTYIQCINGENTHDLSRMDIQRRVRSIMYFYNKSIADRFEELGLEDWAYKENPDNPLIVESRFGTQENFANYTYIKT